jgi:hypothetical protein
MIGRAPAASHPQGLPWHGVQPQFFGPSNIRLWKMTLSGGGDRLAVPLLDRFVAGMPAMS